MFCPACVRGAGPQRICSRQKASAAALPVTPSRKPRTCGEKFHCFVRGNDIQGSPPRMRGKEPELGHSLRTERITPAYAGKSLPTTLVSRSKRDHPRVCGEKRQERLQPVAACGSPPRMRGKATPSTASGCGVRITPAYAGKSDKHQAQLVQAEDHPRVCGEKSFRSTAFTVIPGSPPRMRGKVISIKPNWCKLRITPAYAGKSE